MIMYEGRVVGVSFSPAKENILKAAKFFESIHKDSFSPKIRLQHNPSNPYDNNAIEVHLGQGDSYFFVGHVPRTHNHEMVKYGVEKLTAEAKHFNQNRDGIVGLSIVINQPE